jgi:penicillin-binding protein 2
VNFGIGQGYLTVTPLQLAHYASTIATRGKVWKPRLVTALRDPLTGQIHRIPPVPEGEVTGVSPEDWQRVVHGMVGVTTRGTAAAIGAHAPYAFAGKTGTAQVFTVGQNEKYNAKAIDERLRDHSWFIAFAPADTPRIAVAVLQENGGAGASAAAPIARKVLDSYLLGPDGKLKAVEAPTRSPPAPLFRKRLDPMSPQAPQPKQKQAEVPAPPAPQVRSNPQPGHAQTLLPRAGARSG